MANSFTATAFIKTCPLPKNKKKLGFVSRTYIIGTEFPLVAKLWHPVDPESVAQFVGYDKDGREVYEGDVFIVPCGTEIAARFINNLTPNAKLKEVTK